MLPLFFLHIIAEERGMEKNLVLLHPEPVLLQDLLSFTGMCHITYKSSRELQDQQFY